ncbi:MAG: hypothetical protein HQM16_10270 [Deltaproteobacteria bacterium]|nr:hypothetical protein [Deltaproteobacteria bacterium]
MFTARLMVVLFCLCLLFSPTLVLAKKKIPDQSSEGQVLLWKFNQTGNKALIPDISLIGIVSGAYFRDDPATVQWPNPTRTGFNLQAAELGIQSVVDPYIRADVFIHMLEDGLEVEEAFITTLTLPLNLQIRAGKFRARLGRENTQHLDQKHFADYSRLRRYFLGNEGLTDLGAELSVLLPVSWFSELSFDFMQGRNDVSFDSPRKQDFLYVGHWANSFNLTTNLTMQVGVSGAFGNNVTVRKLTQIYAGDLYLRWRPHERRGFKWETEYYYRSLEGAVATAKEGGVTTSMVYQFARRFEAGARFDAIGFPEDAFSQYQVSPILTFVATEFFRLRGQYNFLHTDGAGKKQHEAFLQLMFNMGPHGAHSF